MGIEPKWLGLVGMSVLASLLLTACASRLPWAADPAPTLVAATKQEEMKRAWEEADRAQKRTETGLDSEIRVVERETELDEAPYSEVQVVEVVKDYLGEMAAPAMKSHKLLQWIRAAQGSAWYLGDDAWIVYLVLTTDRWANVQENGSLIRRPKTLMASFDLEGAGDLLRLMAGDETGFDLMWSLQKGFPVGRLADY